MSQLIFVPVPGGVREDGTMILRLMVVPRLDTGSLADNGLTSWPPDQVREPLLVTFTTDGDAPTTVDITPRLSDQDGLWSAVFGRATVSTAAAVRRDAADPVTMTPTSVHLDQLNTSYRAVVQAFATAAATDPLTASAAYADAARTQLSAPPWAPSPPPISLAPSDPPPTVPPAADPPPAVPPTDVNRIYGTLREHPHVLTALGLILELDIPPGSVPEGAGTVRVDWPAADAVTPALPPVLPQSTAYLGDTFLPAPHVVDPQTRVLDGGMVCLDDDTRWQLAAVDVEAGRLRMTGAATSGPDPTIARGDATTPKLANALPTLRTAGLTLVRAGRADDFAYRRARALAVAADDAPVLYAEDLVLGYRLDVRSSDGDGTWHPLCTRQATYRVNDVLVGEAGLLEEGHVKAHAAHRNDGGPLLADEVVARWDGWSLAVPRPFPPSVVGDDPGDGTGLSYRLGTDFTVPAGSLPPLRFGTSYEVRARVADLAGGGLAADDALADQHAIGAFLFSRYEPVLAPTLLLPDGADADNLGPAVHVAQLVVTSEGGGATTVDPVTPAQTQRVLARPLVSLTTAEWHGALVGDADATWPVAQLAVAGRLPDPAAVGLAASVVPESGSPAADAVRQSWRAWPDTTAMAIQLQPCAAGADLPVLSFGAGQLIVNLAPAQDIAVQLASTVAPAHVPSLAVTGWSADEGVAGLADAGLAATTSGQHPLVTPGTTLRCVHAVRRPLVDPSGGLEVARTGGVVPVTITPTRPLFGVDAASTGQVDITASWTEVTDGVRTDLTDVPVQSLVVNRGDLNFAQAITHHLPDTRHRDVTYTVTAVSRFGDFFPAGPDEAFTATPLTCAVDVPSTNRPASPKVRGIVPAFVWEQASGPTTITRTRYGNRIRVELEGPWFDSGGDERLALVMAAPDTTDLSNTTQAGRDPMYITPICDRYPPAAAVTRSGDAAATVITDDNMTVDVVPSEVFFNAAAGRWFADFLMPGVAGDTYTPMLRPALARYQQHSVTGCELSPVVLGDFVPLMPDRTLTVSVEVAADRSQFTVTVTLSGPQPDGAWLNEVDAIIERGGQDTDLTIVNPNRTSVGWFAPPDQAQRGMLGQPIVFTRPFESLADLRVRVRDSSSRISSDPTAPGLPPDEWPSMGTFAEVGSRPVFIDTVPL